MAKEYDKEPEVVAMAPRAPNPGAGDCYNRVTETCNQRHPGKNWGDKEYRDCISTGLDWCDGNEPVAVTQFPILNANGRFQVPAASTDELHDLAGKDQNTSTE